MTRRLSACLAAIVLCLCTVDLRAQEFASLVADSISIDPSGRLTASGNVEILVQGTRLTATSVTYRSDGDQLTLSGPIHVTDEDGTVFLADHADLDRRLRDGVLVSARMVLEQHFQIAANRIARTSDRYTRLDRVVASSCEVCATNPVPLWEIRASRVVHDDVENQLYFTNARLRFSGVPILYVPRLRLPDPSLDRADGFLIPQFKATSDLGTGVKLPYFLAFGNHRDITVTPYLSSSTTTVEFRYRQELERGRIEATGAVSSDDIAGSRNYLLGNARHLLPRGFLFEAQAEYASDPGYLFTYDYADRDRLTNQLSVTRVRNKDLFRSEFTEYRTLRDAEIESRDTLPARFLDIHYERELPKLSFGGRTFAGISSSSLIRPSSESTEEGVGRDVSRIGASVDWSRTRTLSSGLVARAELGFRGDGYTVAQDRKLENNLSRLTSRTALELRFPMGRRNASGRREFLEPILRIDASGTNGDVVPNEDSRVVEIDEANLFAPTRYPGIDRRDDGLRVAVGGVWSRENPGQWDVDLALGRVFSVSGGQGPDGSADESDWLVSGRLGFGRDLAVHSRSLVAGGLDITLSETRLDWSASRHTLSSSYFHAVPDAAKGRDDRLSEWSFEGAYDVGDGWTARADWRYDFAADRAARTKLGLDYRTECVHLALSLSRRFANSTSVDSTTEIGFHVSLLGIGSRDDGRAGQRICRG